MYVPATLFSSFVRHFLSLKTLAVAGQYYISSLSRLQYTAREAQKHDILVNIKVYLVYYKKYTNFVKSDWLIQHTIFPWSNSKIIY